MQKKVLNMRRFICERSLCSWLHGPRVRKHIKLQFIELPGKTTSLLYHVIEANIKHVLMHHASPRYVARRMQASVEAGAYLARKISRRDA